MIRAFSEEQKDVVNRVVPWFLANMPAAYFKQVPEKIRNEHIKAITAIRELGQAELSLKIDTKGDNDFMQSTYISNQKSTGLLSAQLAQVVVPEDHELSNVKVFQSMDHNLSLNMFSFQSTKIANKVATVADAKKIFDFVAEVKAGKTGKYDASTVPKYDDKFFSVEAITSFLSNVSPSYARTVSPVRFMNHRLMYEKVHDNDGTDIHIGIPKSEGHPESSAWITIAAANVLPEVLLRLTSTIISGRNLDIQRAHLDSMASAANSTPEIAGNVTLLRLLVSPVKGKVDWTDPKNEYVNTLKRDLKRAKWLDNSTTELGLTKYPAMGLDKAEVITAYCSMLHGPLSKENSQAFASIKSVVQCIDSHPNFIAIAENIAALFLDRFNTNGTGISDAVFTARSQDIQRSIDVLQHENPKLVLNKMLAAVGKTLRTNFYNEDRYALSMRIHPSVMASDKKVEPFGVFFVHGRHFNAFHCRFRDIARGGLRLVTPPNSDQYALESTRQFDEAYGLSYAQQLKNKDIPEGGSKGVILINTPSITKSNHFFTMRKSVKGFADALLDLIVEDSVQNLVDLYGKDELVYLGPDEQIIPSDIAWVIKRAAQRGYPTPDAFMSSKADNGFNHKDYGVTSEGVAVYLDVALRKVLNINPNKDSFTVKITGGPDGDVAGNLIRILFRDYGNNCKVVGIADGFGVAEDPNGLDSAELLRLVKASLPITEFNKAKLSRQGVAMAANTDEGMARRNSMHFRVRADAFVPAGGRPNTTNITNWRQFLLEDGKTPSSPLMVEGANIFTTPEARELLFEHGKVAIVKDSSANKCGVMTSSYEVAAAMLLSKEEFMPIKAEIVEDVLVKLRHVARLEADLLFREYSNYPGALPHFSERISFAIAKVTDAITTALANVQPEDPLFQELFPLIRENLPTKLAQVAGDRIASRYPVQYQRAAIASSLAAKLVYQEGVHLIEQQPLEHVAERAFEYYRADRKVQDIVKKLEKQDFGANGESKSVVINMLKKAGARALVDTL